MTARELISNLKGVKKSGSGWVARCPSHDDTRASLSIGESFDGHLLLKCHAGCEFETILASVSHGNAGRQIVETYDYKNENGKLLYQSVRFTPKDFCQRRPNSAGGWAWNLNGTPRVLYRLPELLAADPDRVVFIVEGEKDCHQLVEIGLVATTNSGGAGKWRAEYNEPLRGRQVVILPDNDEPGRKHADAVAKSLVKIAASVRVVQLPGLPEKGDVSYWLASGNGIENLRRLVEGTAAFEPISDNEDGPATATADDEVLRQLAELSLLEYERQRLTAAKSLKCRPATLDKLIGALRPKQEGLQGREVEFADVELWPEPVTGEVLNEVSETFSRYLALPPGAADILAVWCVHAHLYDVFTCTPRLNITSPEARCGKTLARDVVHQFVPRPLSTENLTVAVIFRLIESRQPTILADEYDTWIHGNDELRGVMNAGHRRGGQALRCEGEGNEVRAFNVFAPAVLCGIGALPGTLNDRAIKVRLERAKPGEVGERFDSRHIEREQEICRKLARWCADNRELIDSSDPALPDTAYNRVADNWRPIFAIAEVAGGDWPQRISEAFTKQSSAETSDEGLATMLLADIREIFSDAKVDRLFSKDLVEKLLAMTERPWPEARKEKPITESWLARRLKRFGVLPKSIRIGTGNAKGYELSAFQEPFERYLAEQGVSSRHSVTHSVNIDENSIPNRHNEKACDGTKTPEGPYLLACDAVTAKNPHAPVIASDEREERIAIQESQGRRRYEPVFDDPERQAAWDSWRTDSQSR